MKKYLSIVFIFILGLVLVSCGSGGGQSLPTVNKADQLALVTEQDIQDFIDNLDIDNNVLGTLKFNLNLDASVKINETLFDPSQDITIKGNLDAYINNNAEVHSKLDLKVKYKAAMQGESMTVDAKVNGGLYVLPANDMAYLDIKANMKVAGMNEDLTGKYKLPLNLEGEMPEFGDFDLDDILAELDLANIDVQEILDLIADFDFLTFYRGADYHAIELNLKKPDMVNIIGESLDEISVFDIHFIVKLTNSGVFEIGGSLRLEGSDSHQTIKIKASFSFRNGVTMPAFPNFNGYVDFDENIFPFI